jgi:hypothetical protein
MQEIKNYFREENMQVERNKVVSDQPRQLSTSREVDRYIS